MIHWFRQKKKSLNWVLWVVIIVLGAGMLLLFVDPPQGNTSVFGNSLASVAGNQIGVEEFRRHYGQMVQDYEQRFNISNNPEILRQLRLGDQALNQLIGVYATVYEAKRLGLDATDQEVTERIREFPAFRNAEGSFVGFDEYRRILVASRLDPAEFEAGVRRQILQEKLVSLITDGIEPTPQQIRAEFDSKNRQSRVRYVAFDKDNVKMKEVTQAELEQFFQDNSDSFKLPEERKISYLKIPVDLQAVEVGEAEIESRIEDIPAQERIRASHIIFRVPPEGDDSDARRRARSVLQQIRNGADFAEMAKQYSEDDSAVMGGDLGYFTRGQMDPDFETPAFALQEGEVSGLVKSPFGIHLIKVTSVPSDLEEGRRLAAEWELRQERAEDQVRERAQALRDEIAAGAELEEVANREGLDQGTTDFFKLGDTPAGLGTRSDFNQQVFAASTGAAVGPYLAGDTFLVAQVEDVKAAQLRKFEEVRDQVEEQYREQKIVDLAESEAWAFYRAVQAGAPLEEKAKEYGVPVTETGFFGPGDTVDDTLKFSPLLHERLPLMKVGQVSPPVPVSQKQVVFQLLEKSEVEEAAFENQKQQIAEQLRIQQRNAFYQAYVQNVMDRLRQQELIEINREVLEAITG